MSASTNANPKCGGPLSCCWTARKGLPADEVHQTTTDPDAIRVDDSINGRRTGTGVKRSCLRSLLMLNKGYRELVPNVFSHYLLS